MYEGQQVKHDSQRIGSVVEHRQTAFHYDFENEPWAPADQKEHNH